MPPLAYLDTNIVVALVKQDYPAEQQALSALIELQVQGAVELVTSTVMQEEIEKFKGETKPALALFEALRNVTTVEVLPMPQVIEQPAGRSRIQQFYLPAKDQNLAALEVILDETDARHVFQALSAKADYFVTLDKRTILGRREKVEAQFPIGLRLPSDLVSELASAVAS